LWFESLKVASRWSSWYSERVYAKYQQDTLDLNLHSSTNEEAKCIDSSDSSEKSLVWTHENRRSPYVQASALQQQVQIGDCMQCSTPTISNLQVKQEKAGKSSTTSSIKVCDSEEEDQFAESVLTQYLKQKYRKSKHRKLKKLRKETNLAKNSEVKDDFKHIYKWLMPMKKKRMLQSIGKSKNSSNYNSMKSSRNASPNRMYLKEILTNTELFYKKEMVKLLSGDLNSQSNATLDVFPNDIKSPIYSSFKWKFIQKKHKKYLKHLHGSSNYKKWIKDENRCSECLKVCFNIFLFTII